MTQKTQQESVDMAQATTQVETQLSSTQADFEKKYPAPIAQARDPTAARLRVDTTTSNNNTPRSRTPTTTPTTTKVPPNMVKVQTKRPRDVTKDNPAALAKRNATSTMEKMTEAMSERAKTNSDNMAMMMMQMREDRIEQQRRDDMRHQEMMLLIMTMNKNMTQPHVSSVSTS